MGTAAAQAQTPLMPYGPLARSQPLIPTGRTGLPVDPCAGTDRASDPARDTGATPARDGGTGQTDGAAHVNPSRPGEDRPLWDTTGAHKPAGSAAPGATETTAPRRRAATAPVDRTALAGADRPLWEDNDSRAASPCGSTSAGADQPLWAPNADLLMGRALSPTGAPTGGKQR